MAWRTVSHGHPCTICGKTDWCSYTDDETAVICRREDDPLRNAIHRVNRTGGHEWLYLSKPAPGRVAVRPEVEPPKHKYEVADASTLDRFYRQLLERLPFLEGGHDLDLTSRGLLRSDIEALGFRSWPRVRGELKRIATDLLKTFDGSVFRTIPGFWIAEQTVYVCKKCGLTCKGDVDCEKVTKINQKLKCAWSDFSGYVIPVRDLQGRIVRLQLRSDEENPTRRYVYFSSADENSCGGPMALHVPDRSLLLSLDPSEVWITEGVLKAELSSRKLGKLVLGLPSVSATALAFPVLEELTVNRVVIALDSDARTKPQVAGALCCAAHSLAEQGYEVVLATWTSDRGKGLDDVLAHHDSNVIQLVEGLDMWRQIADLLRASGAPDDPLLQARIVLHDLHQRLATDPSIAFRTNVLAAAAQIARHGSEGQSFLALMKQSLPGQFTTWTKSLEGVQKQLVRDERDAEAKALGKAVFKRGDDAELAALLVDQLASEFDWWDSKEKKRFVRPVQPVAAEGRLYRYVRERGIWEHRAPAALSCDIQGLAGSRVGGDGTLKVFASTVKGTIACAEARCSMPRYFDNPTRGVAFSDCFVAVDKGALAAVSHSPEHRCRYEYPFPYRKEVGPPLKFLALLESAFDGDSDKDDKIKLIQEFSGACRLGLGPKYQKVLFFYGPNANDGKSTIGSVLARTMPPGSISKVRPDQMGEKFELAPIAGALLNIADEVGTKPIDKAEVFKEVVTAKLAVQGERKGQDPFLFLPVAGHLLLGNHFLLADDFSNGFLRRFVVIGFNHSIPESQVIVGIEDDIIEDECEQIVRWALEGAARLLSAGKYTIPASAIDLAVEWKNKADVVHAFISDEYVETDDPKAKMKLKDLYERYVKWADEKGHRRLAENTFGSRLQRWKSRSSDGNGYALAPKSAKRDKEKDERNAAIAEQAGLRIEEEREAAEMAEIVAQVGKVESRENLDSSDDEDERMSDLQARRNGMRWAELCVGPN